MSFSRVNIRVLLALVFVCSILFALIAEARKAEVDYMWLGGPVPMSGFEPTPAAQPSVP